MDRTSSPTPLPPGLPDWAKQPEEGGVGAPDGWGPPRLLVINPAAGQMLAELAVPPGARIATRVGPEGRPALQLRVCGQALAVVCDAAAGLADQEPLPLRGPDACDVARPPGSKTLLVFSLEDAALAAAEASLPPGTGGRRHAGCGSAPLAPGPVPPAAGPAAAVGMVEIAAGPAARQARDARVRAGLTALVQQLLGDAGGGGQAPPLLLGAGL
jgi:hypothetical protein